jgi:hypothetical protein
MRSFLSADVTGTLRFAVSAFAEVCSTLTEVCSTFVEVCSTFAEVCSTFVEVPSTLAEVPSLLVEVVSSLAVARCYSEHMVTSMRWFCFSSVCAICCTSWAVMLSTIWQ